MPESQPKYSAEDEAARIINDAFDQQDQADLRDVSTEIRDVLTEHHQRKQRIFELRKTVLNVDHQFTPEEEESAMNDLLAMEAAGVFDYWDWQGLQDINGLQIDFHRSRAGNYQHRYSPRKQQESIKYLRRRLKIGGLTDRQVAEIKLTLELAEPFLIYFFLVFLKKMGLL